MAIIKYRVEAKGGPMDIDVGSRWQYEECYNPMKGGKLLTREEALKIIEEKGLVLVHHNMFGSIWDEPHEPMFQEYNGMFRLRRKH